MKVSLENLIPGTGKLNGIFRAVVEDNKDTEKRGRVRVRIFGVHTQVIDSTGSQGIPTKHLPWAEPVCSTIEGSISGCGLWAVPVQGSHVFMFFENGNINQPRYFASAPGGAMKTKPDKKTGFSDPDEEYPLDDWINEADFHRLARDESKDTYVDKIKEELLDIEAFTEPDPFYEDSDKKYPNNIVLATHGGHVFEIDNTEDGERFTYYHPSHSYLQISSKGDLILRNENDRYMITMNDYNEYVDGDRTSVLAGDDTTTVDGDQDLYIMGDQTFFVEGTQDILCAGENTQTFSAQYKQYIASGLTQQVSAKGTQNVSCMGNQTISFKGNQGIQGWGNQDRNVKGMMSDRVYGAYMSSLGGMHLNSTVGLESEQSLAPKFIGGSMTFIGKKPMQQAAQTAQSTLDGVTAGIRNALQPFYEMVGKIQEVIGETIGNALSEINTILQPITNIVNDINAAINYVKSEYNYARQLITTVMNAPQQIIGSIMNQIQTIAAIPGMLISSTISKITGSVGQIALLNSLTTMYSSINDFGFQLPDGLNFLGQGTNYLSQFSSLINLDRFTSLNSTNPSYTYQAYVAEYYPNGIDIDTGQNILAGYPRSGLASYVNGVYERKWLEDSTNVSNIGTLLDEMAEMDSFVADAIASSFISPSGIWLLEDTLEHLRESQAVYLNTLLKNTLTVNQLLNPLEITLPIAGYVVDGVTLDTACPPGEFSEATSGYFVDSVLVSIIDTINEAAIAAFAPILEEYEIDLGIYESEMEIYQPIYDQWVLDGSIPPEPEAPIAPDDPGEADTYSLDYSIYELIPILSFSQEALVVLYEARNDRIPNYVTLVTTTIKEQLYSIFIALMYLEEVFLRELVNFLNDDDTVIEWEGKFDDWPPEGINFSGTWPPSSYTQPPTGFHQLH